MQAGQLLSSMITRMSQVNPKQIELTPGQVFKGTVTKLYPDNMAQVQIGGIQVQAKLEANLEVGQKAWLQVQPTSNPVTLKVLTSPDNPQELQDTSVEGLMRSLGIADSKESQALVEALVKQNLPVNKETVNAFLEVAKAQGNTKEVVDAFLLAMKRNLPVTSDVVGSLKAFLSGKPLADSIQQFLYEAESFLQSEPQPTSDSASLRQLLSRAATKLADLPIQLTSGGLKTSATAEATSTLPVPQSELTPTAVPLPKLTITKETPGTTRLTPNPWPGSSQSATVQENFAQMPQKSAQFSQYPAQFSQNLATDKPQQNQPMMPQAAQGQLSQNPGKTADSFSNPEGPPEQVAQEFNQTGRLASEEQVKNQNGKTFEMFQMRSPNESTHTSTQTNTQAVAQGTTEGSAGGNTQLNKSPTDQAGKQLPGNSSFSPEQGSETLIQPQQQGSQAKVSPSQNVNHKQQLQSVEIQQQGSTLSKVETPMIADVSENQSAMQKASESSVASAATQEDQPLVLKDLFQKLGLSHERQMVVSRTGGGETAVSQSHLDSVKSLLMQVSQSSGQLPESLKQAADSLLQQVTGQQLLLTQPNNQVISQIVMQIPLRTDNKDTTAFVQIESKKRDGGQLDAENCRLFLNLDLHVLGITMVDVNIVNKIVNINIYNNSQWIDGLVSQAKDSFSAQLRDTGYQLSHLKTQPIPRNKITATNSVTTGQLGSTYKGVDLRV